MLSTRSLALATAALLAPLLALAEPAQSVLRDSSLPLQATAVSSDGTPDTLAGSLGSVRFSDGSSASALFTAQGSGLGSSAVAFVDGVFALRADAGPDTSRPGGWSVVNLTTDRTLVGFTLDGLGQGQGSAGFDVSVFTTTADTPGSNSGVELTMSFAGRSFIAGTVTITYSRPVALAGQPAAGDLFSRVDVALAYTTAGLNGGLPPIGLFGSVFSTQNFGGDLDRVVYAPVPEPAALALMLAGLGGLAGVARRRRQQG